MGLGAALTFPAASSPRFPAAISLAQDNVLRILGTKGRIEVPDFWFAGGNRDVGLGKIDLIHPDGKRETISVNETRHLYSFEVDAAGEAILLGPAGIRLAGHGLGRQPRQPCACSTNGGQRLGSNTRSRRPRGA